MALCWPSIVTPTLFLPAAVGRGRGRTDVTIWHKYRVNPWALLSGAPAYSEILFGCILYFFLTKGKPVDCELLWGIFMYANCYKWFRLFYMSGFPVAFFACGKEPNDLQLMLWKSTHCFTVAPFKSPASESSGIFICKYSYDKINTLYFS